MQPMAGGWGWEHYFPSGVVKRGRALPRRHRNTANQAEQGPGPPRARLVSEGGQSGLHGLAINRGSRIQCFPQAAQLLETANSYFCSFLSLGLFMHLK